MNANKQALGHFYCIYFEEEHGRRTAANTGDEARRIAANISELPERLGLIKPKSDSG